MSKPMKSYRCHKTVKASKVLAVQGAYVVTESGHKVMGSKLKPLTGMPLGVAIGGYVVVYEDGYTSWSPGNVFEEGYSLVPDGAVGSNGNGPG